MSNVVTPERGPIRLFLLGGFRLEIDGQVMPGSVWVRRSARTLVEILATDPTHILHREQLQQLLWPDLSLEAGKRNLRRAMHFARRALESHGGPAPETLIAEGELVMLAPARSARRLWIDAEHFEAIASKALSDHDPSSLATAIAAYGGELLPEEPYADWATARRIRLSALHHRLLEELAGHRERAGDVESAISLLSGIVEREPTREDVHRRLMWLHVRRGSRHAALRQYQICREALRADVDTAPEPETQALYYDLVARRVANTFEPPVAMARQVFAPEFLERTAATPFVGRRRIMQLFSSDQPLPGLILIAGEAGVGKTRVAVEVARRLSEAGWMVLWGQAREHEGRIAYAPVVEALETYFRDAHPDEAESVTAMYPELGRILPSLALRTGTRAESKGRESQTTGSSESERARLFAAVASVLRSLTSERPVLVVLDDLHAADTATIQLLSYVHRHSAGLTIGPALDTGRLVILATVRSEDVAEGTELGRNILALASEPRCRRAELQGLSREASDQLVLSLLGPSGTRVDPALLARLYDLTVGNPFFLIQLVRALEESQLVIVSSEQWEALPGAFERLPSQTYDLVELRLARFPAQERRILELAAVAGMQFSFAVVTEAARIAYGTHIDDNVIVNTLERSLQARLLAEQGEGYAFRHPLLRKALYEHLTKPRSSQLHRALAQAVELRNPEEAEILAHHYLQGGEQEKAVEHLRRAGDRARDVYANEAAATYYRQLLDRLRTMDRPLEEADAREKLGQVLGLLSRYDEALAELEPAFRMHQATGDLERLGRVAAQMGRLHRNRGSSSEGIELVESTLAAIESTGRRAGVSVSSEVVASLHLALAHLFFASGRYTDQLRAAKIASELAHPLPPGDQRVLILADAECRRGTALDMLGDHARAIDVLQGAISLAEQAGDDDTLQYALGNLAASHESLGDLATGLSYRARSVEVARRMDNRARLAWAIGNKAGILQMMGRWDEAREGYSQAVEMYRAIGVSWYTAYALSGLGFLTYKMGDAESAVRYAREAIEIAEQSGDAQALRMLHGWLAEVEITEGRLAEALRRLRGVLTPDNEAYILPTIARGHIAAGDADQAERDIDRAIALMANGEPAIEFTRALEIKGWLLCARGRHDEADAVLRNALASPGSSICPEARAPVLHAWGHLHLARGDQKRASENFGAAIDIFNRLGNRLDAEMARTDLATLDSSFQKSTETVNGLTDAEWDRVAQLLPRPRTSRGRPRADDRAVVNGVLWVLRNQAAWADVPEGFGAPATCWRRWKAWQVLGVWDRVMEVLDF